MSDTRSGARVRALAVGTVLQLAMVVVGHSVPAVAAMFAVGGMAISLAAGGLYAWWARAAGGAAAIEGALVGGGCALPGILVSFLLGDVQAIILAFGTLSSAVTGLLGALAGGALARRRPAAPPAL